MTRHVIAVVAVALGLAASPSLPAPALSSGAGPRCPVTPPPRGLKGLPKGGGPFSASHFNFGNGRIRVELWPRARLVAGTLPGGGSRARILPDGSIDAKVGWWRGVPGRLSIRGQRLYLRAAPLRADVPDGYGDTGFVPTILTFPTIGCWKVVGHVGSASLAFVVLVSKLRGR